MDFTTNKVFQIYKVLLHKGFSFITFKDYVKGNIPDKFVILRYDVEQYYSNALKFAQIQHDLGIKGTYYFRILSKCFSPDIVKQIADLGHEAGYHYDDLTQCKGNYKKAIARFQKNLKTLRDIAPISTICMDGSPWSKFDNKDLWRKREIVKRGKGEVVNERKEERTNELQTGKVIKLHYKDYGIIGEPYFDVDFDNVFYLTDTGRRWDGWKVSLRDKIPQQEKWIKKGLVFRSTGDIIKAANEDKLPGKMMMTFHPQRWNDKPIPWVKELVLQSVKNQVKMVLVKRKNRSVKVK